MLLTFGTQVDISALFYADDGKIASHDPSILQAALDKITDMFAAVGLKLNAAKMKAMVTQGGAVYLHQSDEAYKRRMTGEGDEFAARKRRLTQCPLCEKKMQEKSLPIHLRVQHEMILQPEPAESKARAGPYTISSPRANDHLLKKAQPAG